MRTSLMVLAAWPLVTGCVTEPNGNETSESEVTVRDAHSPDAHSPDARATTSTDDVALQLTSASIDDGWLSVELTRSEPIYLQMCSDAFGVQGLEPGQEDWVRRDAIVVSNGSFVDGEYWESPGCDFVDCIELTRFGDTLGRLEPMGEVAAERGGALPAGWKDAGSHPDGGVLLPVFETRTLTGRVRVWFDYHLDAHCADSGARYEVELDLNRLEASDSG